MTELVPRPLTPAGVRIVEAAEELFYGRGIRAVGVDAVAEAAGTTKKTLYDQFGSKDALVTEYLVRRALRWQHHLAGRLDGLGGTAAVLAVFDAAQDWMADSARGCAFVNAHAEVAGTSHPAGPVVRAEKQWMLRRFAGLLAAAGHPGEDLAEAVHLLYEGALVVATAGGRPGAIGRARDVARGLVTTTAPR